MSVTAPTAQPSRGRSKARAPVNIERVLATRSTRQAPTSRVKAAAPSNMFCMAVTAEVSHAPTSSLKRAAWAWRWSHHDAQNSSLMSVTRCVSHVAMSPYRQTATRRASVNQAATAARRLVSFIAGPRSATPLQFSTVGAAVTVGACVTVGAGDGRAQLTPLTPTPHDVDAHWVPSNASSRFTLSSTHQPRSWSKAWASMNISSRLVTL